MDLAAHMENRKFFSLEWKNDGVMNDNNDKNDYEELIMPSIFI